MHQNFPVQKENDSRRWRVLWMSDWIVPHYAIVRNNLSLTYMHLCTNNHVHISSPLPHLLCAQNNVTAFSINSTVADNGFSPASAPSFYDLLCLQYIPNALSSCLHTTFQMWMFVKWTGMKWGKKRAGVLFPPLNISSSHFSFICLSHYLPGD